MKGKRKISLGSWITIGHPIVAEIMADSGFDWLCIDIEHSTIDYSVVQQLISEIQSRGIEAFVRVGENSDLIIKRVLDAGADGIIVPSVNSPSEAIAAVNAVNYPPKGTRGVGLARAQKYGFGFDTYVTEKGKEIKLIVQIEHFKAISHLEEILKVDGIHGTFIGPYDLSGSLGKPGQYDDPEVKELLSDYENIVKSHDKLIGFHIIKPDASKVLEKIESGYNFLAFSTDALFFGTKMKDELKDLREKL